MLRSVLCSLTLLAFAAVALHADDQTDKNKSKDQSKTTTSRDKNQHKSEAKITKVDPKSRTVTVHMKDKDGKEVDRTFNLTEDVRMVDDTGRVAALDVFQSGDYVLVVEGEGRLREMHKQRQGANSGSSTNKQNKSGDNR